MNNALNGEGPFSPERAGTIPARQLVDLCFSGKYTYQEIRKLLNGKGGLLAHLGTTDVPTIVRWAHAGNKKHQLVLEAMIYTVAKQVGAMHVALHGQTDAIILTGGIAYNAYCVALLREWLEGLAPIEVIPGEDEMGALASNALGVLRGELPLGLSPERRLTERAEKGNQKRHTEVDDESMKDGYNGKLLSGGAYDNGQSGVHGGGSSGRYRCQIAEPAYQEWGAQKGQQFTYDVRQQGNRAQFCSPVFGDEYAGEGIISESGTDCQAVGEATVRQKQTGYQSAGKGTENGH